MRSKTVAGILLAATVLLGGCGTPGSTTASAAGTTTASLDFTATELDAGTFDGEQLEGTPTVLWFWAPWCATCRAQAGPVADLAQEYEGRVDVVGVGGLSPTADIEEFARGVEGPTHLVDEEGAVWRHFDVTAQSTYVVLDADSTIVGEGYLEDDELAAQVAELAG